MCKDITRDTKPSISQNPITQPSPPPATHHLPHTNTPHTISRHHTPPTAHDDTTHHSPLTKHHIPQFHRPPQSHHLTNSPSHLSLLHALRSVCSERGLIMVSDRCRVQIFSPQGSPTPPYFPRPRRHHNLPFPLTTSPFPLTSSPLLRSGDPLHSFTPNPPPPSHPSLGSSPLVATSRLGGLCFGPVREGKEGHRDVSAYVCDMARGVLHLFSLVDKRGQSPAAESIPSTSSAPLTCGNISPPSSRSSPIRDLWLYAFHIPSPCPVALNLPPLSTSPARAVA